MKRAHHEDDHARALIRWRDLAANSYPELKLLIHIPNGGKRNAREAARLKAQGTRAGVWDYFLPIGRIFPSGPKLGLWLELKIKPNKLTPAQQHWGALMEQEKYATYVAYDWREAAAEICGYLGLIGAAP